MFLYKGKEMRRSKSMIVVWLAAMSLLFLGQPIPAEDNYQVSYTVQFSADELVFYRHLGWDMVRLQDGSHLAELGEPMLPAKEIRIALPAGMAVTGVQIAGTTQERIPGRFNILPAQPAREIGSSDDDVKFVQPDLADYS